MFCVSVRFGHDFTSIVFSGETGKLGGLVIIEEDHDIVILIVTLETSAAFALTLSLSNKAAFSVDKLNDE